MLFTSLFVLLYIPALAAETGCGPLHKSVTVLVTADFYIRPKAPNSHRVITASPEFINAYQEYSKNMAKSNAVVPEFETPPLPDSLPHPPSDTDPASYTAFGATVSADISKVFIAVSTARAPPLDSDCTCPGKVYTGTATLIQDTQSSGDAEVHLGYLQLVRKLTYHVTIGGVTAHLEEETLYSSMSIDDDSLGFSELIDFAKSFVSETYAHAGGQVSGKSFEQTKCYKLLTDDQTDRLSDLEGQVAALEEKVSSLQLKALTQDDEISAQEEELTAVKLDLAGQDVAVTSLRESLTEQDASLRDTLNETIVTLTAQDAVLVASITSQGREFESMAGVLDSLNSDLATQYDVILSLNETMTVQNGELGDELVTLTDTLNANVDELGSIEGSVLAQGDEVATLRSSVAGHSTQVTDLRSRIAAMEHKQTKIVNAPQGLRDISCLVTCVGATGPGTTVWTGSKLAGPSRSSIVDTSSCGFVSTPVVSATVDSTHGDLAHWIAAVFNVNNIQFTIYMEGLILSTRHSSQGDVAVDVTTTQKFNINWHATGYTC